ncbi:MAG: hypothetical protein NTV06_07985, partial [candidate division Zixibacteria bacterium]|nr:hypothetical protein [candidate division Zixibacteria bacterium]
PIEAARLINDDLKSWFKFDPIYYYHPTDQGFSEMRRRRRGRCEDMTNLAIFAMRANGLAVTSDYTPFWADAGNNHAWNAIVTPSGKVIPFMGAESNPNNYHLANKLAKIYRKMYEKHPENLIFQKGKDEKIPSWLAGKDYLDVTADYTSVCDIAVRLAKPVPDSIGVAYLCVFNSGEWQAIDWGRIKDNTATFKAVGADIVYLPAFYIDEKIVPAGPPFLLTRDSGMAIFNPDKERLIPLSLISTTNRKLEVSTDGISHTFLAPGQEYELSYWDNSWQSIGKSVATDKPMVFFDVPSGCLYWLVAIGSHREERIFSIENGYQIWW